jgi:hypothetical protein
MPLSQHAHKGKHVNCERRSTNSVRKRRDSDAVEEWRCNRTLLDPCQIYCRPTLTEK